MSGRTAQLPGSLPAPGPMGRLGRLLLASLAAVVFVLVLMSRLEAPPGTRNPTPLFLVAAIAVLWSLPHLTTIGFGGRWGASPRVVASGIGVALLVVDLILYGRWWAPPLAWYLFALVETVFGLLVVSLLLAAILAVPG